MLLLDWLLLLGCTLCIQTISLNSQNIDLIIVMNSAVTLPSYRRGNDAVLPRQHAPGFALVATVSMMVLLTLVAIAMLSLSTIEQRSSGGGANEADRMARANARMALMIALGELQEAAGPDQRVTATAGILGHPNNTGYSMNGATQENIKDTDCGRGQEALGRCLGYEQL